MRKRSHADPLRVGFVPLTDCAPLVMAQELGLYAKHGLGVSLTREIGWATIRDKIIYDELDAAHALAGLPFAATLGLGSIRCECVAGLVLNLHGNAITLSRDLWSRGVRDARSLRHEIQATRGDKLHTFGVVFPWSSHMFLLCHWLTSGGIDPETDVRIVVVPAPSMFENLKSGNLDGYCVGEPWNSVAVQSGAGWCAATSAQLAPRHPEKVLMARRRFAEDRETQHRALLAAVLEACAYCDRPENREHVVSTLAQPKYINVPVETLRRGMIEPFDFGHGRAEDPADFHVFSRNGANEPSLGKAAWILRHLFSGPAARGRSRAATDAALQVFRPDLFQQAVQLLDPPRDHETAEIACPVS